MFERSEIDGEGIGWGAAALVASILLGVAVEPYRDHFGLTNVVCLYLLVVLVAALLGGRVAGVVAAVSAALSYDFFLTTPYHSLRIDSLSQVVTVLLFIVTGLVASLGGRAKRKAAHSAAADAELLSLVGLVSRSVAAGRDTDQLAAEGLSSLLGARRVAVLRDQGGEPVAVADVGPSDEPVDTRWLARLDEDGRLPAGQWRATGAALVPRSPGVVADMVRQGRSVGSLVVIPGEDWALSRQTRSAIATIATVLAVKPVTGTARTPHN